MTDFGYDQAETSTPFQDNQSAEQIFNQCTTCPASTRHTGMRIARIHERIIDGTIKIEYCLTMQMTADAPSKPMHAGSEEEILKRLTNYRC